MTATAIATAPAPARRRPVGLWRLEVIRLVRSRRAIALFGVFAFFGLTSPFLARYMGEILQRFGGGIEVILPEPVPADGITQFLGNASQIGLLVVLVVAAGALAIDAKPELAAFLRTRASLPRLVVPRYVVSTAAAGLAYTVGLLAAWYESHVLLGALPAGAMLAGIGYSIVYIAFAVAVVALSSAVTRGVLGAVGVSAGVLLALPVLGIVDALERWLPSHLLGAPDALVRGAEVSEFAGAAVVAVLAAAGLVAAAIALLGRREL
jgi:ABC-2 type transport system permease protein